VPLRLDVRQGAGGGVSEGRRERAKVRPWGSDLLQYCTVLYCTVLYCIVLYCTLLILSCFYLGSFSFTANF